MNASSTTQGGSQRILLLEDADRLWDETHWATACRHAREYGFESMLVPWTLRRDGRFSSGSREAQGAADDNIPHILAGLAATCAEQDLRCYVDAEVDDGARLDEFGAHLADWLRAGVSGFRCREVAAAGAEDWALLIGNLRAAKADCRLMAWTPGIRAEHMLALRGAGFDATFSSLPWWDYRSAWLVEEHARLGSVAPVIAPVTADGPACFQADAGASDAAWRRCIWTAAVTGSGVLISERLLQADSGAELRTMNDWLACRNETGELPVILTGALSACTAVFRAGAGVVLNPASERDVSIDWALLQARLPDGYADLQIPGGVDRLRGGACLRFSARRTPPIRPASSSMAEKRKLGLGLMSGPRIAIEHVEPAVDEGRFATKTVVGRALTIEARIFMDGHEQLAACVAYRAADEADWLEAPMIHLGNDRWQATITPTRVGRHVFAIKAWHDAWESFRVGVRKKREAKADIGLDLIEGRTLLREAVHRARRRLPDVTATLQKLLDADEVDADALLSDSTAQAMKRRDARPFETCTDPDYPVMVERRQAEFASWYELFPRSQSPQAGRHGTFADVRQRLPAIRDMGFDVLYFPPIHPIGLTNRKGRNNSLAAAPEDPGSPYAIGSKEGGHDAVHPQLGTLEEFRELLRDAREHGLEIALDFAIQCSPDHPWLAEHRSWFNWRPDGTLRYAENPPKRYEDIVNPDFYHGSQPKARASLWRALRDIVLYWIEQGVRIFRVDNPHTKPLPFWEWMLGEIHAQHPDVVFLSEAFTRPGMMYRLAKLGFSQSYTYFTWRNSKRELTDYLEELNTRPVADFFRPNFFVNTPDINPYFLQTSGQAGFLIRAALAATLSGSWGVYSGFELCEAAPLPGREEYLDSEKYELRPRDWNQPGNIIAQIAQLNRVRKSTPALWSHLGLRFHAAHDDQVLFFSKSTPEGDSIVLVAISLDPRAAHRAWLELPLWMWGLQDDDSLQLEDACAETVFELRGKHHEVELTPQRPYLIWRIRRLA